MAAPGRAQRARLQLDGAAHSGNAGLRFRHRAVLVIGRRRFVGRLGADDERQHGRHDDVDDDGGQAVVGGEMQAEVDVADERARPRRARCTGVHAFSPHDSAVPTIMPAAQPISSAQPLNQRV